MGLYPISSGAKRVLVSLVTYNGARWLPGCVASLRAQTLTDYELRVLDNASEDGTWDLITEFTASEPRSTARRSERNLGFGAAHNQNMARTASPFVVLLNQDVELEPHFLERAIAAFEARPGVAAVQGRLLVLARPGERTTTVDSTGLIMGRSRRVVARRQAEELVRRDLVPGPVWGVDGPAPVYRMDVLRAVSPFIGGGEADGARHEVLDETFFMYKEDVDLAWRLRASGHGTWYEPSAVAWHARDSGASVGTTLLGAVRRNRRMPEWIRAASWTNHRLMMLKNERAIDLLRDLPWIATRELGSLAYMTAFDRARLHAVAKTLRLAPATLAKRRIYGHLRARALSEPSSARAPGNASRRLDS